MKLTEMNRLRKMSGIPLKENAGQLISFYFAMEQGEDPTGFNNHWSIEEVQSEGQQITPEDAMSILEYGMQAEMKVEGEPIAESDVAKFKSLVQQAVAIFLTEGDGGDQTVHFIL